MGPVIAHGTQPALPPKRLLDFVPEPWHARLTGRRLRRWVHASRAVARHNARLPADAPVLNFYPTRPQPQASITAILERLGMRIGFEPAAGQRTIAWDGGTWFSARAEHRLPPDTINGRCLDISKSRVEDVWHQVAGYTLAVDPLVADGPIVAKPEENGRNAGRIVVAPLQRRRKGLVYERLIDCREGDYLIVTRPAIIGYRIVVAYRKWRPYPSWFVGTVLSQPCHPDELYSAPEQATLLRFARAMQMDYGELDVLRDRHSGLLYVVDANRTPGHPRNLPVELEDAAFGPMAEAFRGLLGEAPGSEPLTGS